MPTVLTHPAVPLGLALALGRRVVSPRLLAVGICVSVLPDLDVLAFRLGIPYATQWGHRGFSHSVLFAVLVALLGMLLARHLRVPPQRVFWFLLLATASHGILDAFTNGGLGVAFFWPWSQARFFAPVHPVEVAPISLTRLLTGKGASVLWSELLWVWLPCLTPAIIVGTARYWQRARRR